jgi:hypothetical protein
MSATETFQTLTGPITGKVIEGKHNDFGPGPDRRCHLAVDGMRVVLAGTNMSDRWRVVSRG